MKTAKCIVGLLILVGLVWLGGQRLFPDEQKRIHKMLDALARATSIPPNQTAVQMGLAVDRLLGHVTPDVEVDIEVPAEGRFTFSGREEVRDAALLAHKNLGQVTVRFLDVNISLTQDKQTALADLTVKATKPGEKEFLVQAVKLQLRKVDGQWRVCRAETVKPLKL